MTSEARRVGLFEKWLFDLESVVFLVFLEPSVIIMAFKLKEIF
jgi:hypothetical protein